MTTIDDIPSSVLFLVFSHLDYRDCIALALVQRSWNFLCSGDSLWERLCQKDWLVDPSSCSQDNPQLNYSFKEIYSIYHKDFKRYGSLYLRAKGVWNAIKAWSSESMPEILFTIRAGDTELELDRFEASLNVKLPSAFRVLYRIHDGQSTPDEYHVNEAPLFYGLLGGYSFYNHLVNVRLLSLKACLDYTNYITVNMSHPPDSKLIVIGASFNLLKLVFLDCNTGMVYLGGKNFEIGGLLPAVTMDASNPTNGQSQDQLLVWLEEYSSRLQKGMYSIRNVLDNPLNKSISLFPEAGDELSCQVTNRVKIKASAVFIPEGSDHPREMSPRYLFSYSIRMSLLPSETNSILSFSRCQLRSRHWIIRENGVIISEVHGEAVIGKYPILIDGGDEFVYQSCSEMESMEGSIEGKFTFVPGTLRDPEGPAFDVVIGKFPLKFPNFIF